MAIEIQAPNRVPLEHAQKIRVFLGGAIDMGKAIHWQKKLVEDLVNYDVVLLNPRRDDFQVDAVQSKDNPYFRQQVEWELQGQEQADLCVYFIPAGSQSRITLLEIGMFCLDQEHVICVEEGFDRKGNLDIVAARYDLNLVTT